MYVLYRNVMGLWPRRAIKVTAAFAAAVVSMASGLDMEGVTLTAASERLAGGLNLGSRAWRSFQFRSARSVGRVLAGLEHQT